VTDSNHPRRRSTAGFGRLGLLAGIVLRRVVVRNGIEARACLARVGIPGSDPIRILRFQAGLRGFGQSLACCLRELVAWITPQELLERRLGPNLVVKVVFIDLANPEQRVEAELAAGILAAKEFVLLDC